MSEKGLGKGPGAGLGALFGADLLNEEGELVLSLPISKVEPRANQPRDTFDEESLEELAESLRQYGLIQPITARRLDSGYYQIIAGERRWRAARLAGLTEVPVRVIEADDRRTTELALVENLQREDLNAIEEARGYRLLMDEYGLTQEEAARSVGKSRPAIANALRLLELSPEVLALLEQGRLTAGHARALLSIRDPEKQRTSADQIIAQGLSVRQAESLAARVGAEREKKRERASEAEVNYVKEVERSLTSTLGRRVTIEDRRKRGKIILEYYGPDDLDSLIKRLTRMG